MRWYPSSSVAGPQALRKNDCWVSKLCVNTPRSLGGTGVSLSKLWKDLEGMAETVGACYLAGTRDKPGCGEWSGGGTRSIGAFYFTPKAGK